MCHLCRGHYQRVMKQQDTPHHPAVFSTTSAIDQTCKRCLTIFRSVFVSSFEYLNIQKSAEIIYEQPPTIDYTPSRENFAEHRLLIIQRETQ